MSRRVFLLLQTVRRNHMRVAAIVLTLYVIYIYAWASTSVEADGRPNQDMANAVDVSFKTEKKSAHWTDASEIGITKRRFVSSENGRVFILGAVAKNSTSNGWDELAVYGEWYDSHKINDSALRCCYKYDNGEIMEQIPFDVNIRDFNPDMFASVLLLWHITCKIPRFASDGVNNITLPSKPVWVSISRFLSCNSRHVTYLRPLFAMKKTNGYLTITTKFAFSNLDPGLVVSYLETVKYYGVDKVIVYVCDSLNAVTKRVLRYYAVNGLVDYYAFEFADSGKVKREYPPWNPQFKSDLWLIKRDALERSIGSAYFGIFDMDEFLIPSQNRSYKELLHDLLQIYPKASNFLFRNIHFLTDVPSNDTNCSPNCSIFRRYVTVAHDRFNTIHRKMFLLTSRVATKTITNHQVIPLPGFSTNIVQETEAYVRHYGKCGRKFRGSNICKERHKWRKDTSMIAWAERTVQTRIQNIMVLLNLSQHSP